METINTLKFAERARHVIQIKFFLLKFNKYF